MPGKLILPPNYIDIIDPLIFLAGPITNAPNWQPEAVKIIWSLDPQIYIANPKRIEKFESDDPKELKRLYNEQVDWETYHLKRAGLASFFTRDMLGGGQREYGQSGVIMFYLANPASHRCDRPYAQTTRFELGEWKARHQSQGALLCVGIEKGFTNEKYIRRRFAQDCPTVPLCDTLEETCQETVRLARTEFPTLFENTR